VAHSKTSAPGWAYVPDIGKLNPLQPVSRKRLRTEIGASQHDTTAKQDAKIMRDLAALNQENHRDVSIPVPIKHADNSWRVSHGNKVTPSVRKILQSQKSFANHLADYEALSALSGSSQSTPMPRAASMAISSSSNAAKPRSHKKKEPNELSNSTLFHRVSTTSKALVLIKPETQDIFMADGSSLSLGSATLPPPHPGDSDPLLVSRIPLIPSQEVIDALLAIPPLSYNEARASWVEEDKRKPVRQFCEVCGYWGRVKCTRCGGRVCALECLKVHQEECFTRYGQ